MIGKSGCTKGDFVELDLTNTARKKKWGRYNQETKYEEQIRKQKVAYKDYDVTLIRSNRKSIAIEINRDLQIKVQAPRRMTQNRIMKFITEKQDWIQLHLEKMGCYVQKQEQDDRYSQRSPLTEEEIRKLTGTARKSDSGKSSILCPADGELAAGSRSAIRRLAGEAAVRQGNLNFNCHLAECQMRDSGLCWGC